MENLYTNYRTYMINLWRHIWFLVRLRKLEPTSISKQWNSQLWIHRHVQGHVKLQPRSQAVIFVALFTMAASSGYNDSDVVIVAAGRTPIGNLNGCLSSLKAHELGAIVIRDVLKRGKTPASDVAEVIMGQVCTAGTHKYAYMTNTRLNPFCFFFPKLPQLHGRKPPIVSPFRISGFHEEMT